MTTRMSCSIRDRDPELIAQATDEGRHFLRFVRVHAGRRFVQQEQPGFARQRPGNLQAPLQPVRKVLRSHVALPRQADKAQEPPSLFQSLLLLLPDAGRAEDGADDPCAVWVLPTWMFSALLLKRRIF
jgi:hypothetical protein